MHRQKWPAIADATGGGGGSTAVPDNFASIADELNLVIQAVAAAEAVPPLTDNSGGTASGTIAAIGATYDQAVIANAIASLAAKINAIITALTSTAAVLTDNTGGTASQTLAPIPGGGDASTTVNLVLDMLRDSGAVAR